MFSLHNIALEFKYILDLNSRHAYTLVPNRLELSYAFENIYRFINTNNYWQQTLESRQNEMQIAF